MAKILIIDDRHDIRYSVCEALKAAGHEVAEAGHGGEGMAQCREAVFDLVITDIFMPTMDGVETIRELRRVHPMVKIVAISGGGPSFKRDYLGYAGKLGADRTLAKPFTKRELLSVVDGCLGEPCEPA